MFERTAILHPRRLAIHIGNTSPKRRAELATGNFVFFLAGCACGLVTGLYILSWFR